MELTDHSSSVLASAGLSPKALRTREGLLDAAERRLTVGGDLTSGAVSEEAGVSTGTFYRYFDDKDHILAAAFARQLDGMIDTVERLLDVGVALDHGVGVVLGEVVEALVTGYAASAPVSAAALSRIRASAPIRRVYRTRHDRAVAVFEVFLRRMGTAGLVAVADPRAAAVAAVVVVQGLNHPALRDDPARAVVDAVQRALAGVLGVQDAAEGDHDPQ